MTENKELKPCPFCGGKAYISIVGVVHIGAMHKEDCIVFPNTCPSYGASIEKQIEAWNRRVEE